MNLMFIYSTCTYAAQVTSTSRPRAEAIYMEHSLRGLKDCVRVGIDIGEVEVSTREGQSMKVVTGRILDLVEFVLLP
jgi:lipopolysaccharide biosynthesis regulator YciM